MRANLGVIHHSSIFFFQTPRIPALMHSPLPLAATSPASIRCSSESSAVIAASIYHRMARADKKKSFTLYKRAVKSRIRYTEADRRNIECNCDALRISLPRFIFCFFFSSFLLPPSLATESHLLLYGRRARAREK